ncbi:ABC transporter substrate-binding protein [Gryllotalpicola sp.]|uniref:ABC transporter substrate-binding protein n=1 Tax=Gryllotalpicola sp. TaxID=1932787 RepID=UPI00261C2A18|nr:ABC transporter substrate-binding protein [Gryllotalpicola sp.]
MARTIRLTAAAGVLALAAALAGCASSNPLGDNNPASSPPSTGAPVTSITVGSAAFPESEILAYVYADALQASGVAATVTPNIGARDAYIAALKDGSIDLVPEYTGNLLQYFDAKATAQSSDDVYTALKTAVPQGYEVLDQAAAQDADSYNVTKAFSEKWGVTSLADLKKVTDPITVAANPEFQTRPYGIPGLKSVYGVSATLLPINDGGGPNTLKALLDGKAQLADIYSTTPSITQNNLVTLADPDHMVLAQNVVPLINSGKADAAVTQALDKVQANLTTADLIEMNTKSSVGKESAQNIATEWLKQKNLFG